MTPNQTAVPLRIVPLGFLGTRRSLRVVERNVFVYRSGWIILVSGFFEPLFYLLSIGLGLNHLVGPLDVEGTKVAYTAFVAPSLLATSAMNGALFDATYNMFFKLKISKVYDTMLATPLDPTDVALGELTWSVVRGGLYATAFFLVMAVMGFVTSWWSLLLLPAALLMAAAFGAVGMAVTTFMRSWQDFDLVGLALIPMFLFSATFYPVTVYPGWLQAVVKLTPLYQGVVLARGMALGHLHPVLLLSVAYLAAMAIVGAIITGRRVRQLLLS